MERKMVGKKNRIPLLCLVGAALVSVAYPQPAVATEYIYCGPSQDEGEAWFSDPLNWTPAGGPPGSADVTVFDRDGYYDLYLSQPVITNTLLKVEAGDIEFFMAEQTLDPCDYPVTYELLGSGTYWRSAAIIGVTPGVQAALLVCGGWESHCSPPATINANGMLILGQTAGSNGRLDVGRVLPDNGTATWSSDYPTIVGLAGTGELNIAKPHELFNSSAILGMDFDAVGTAEVKGTWSNNGTLKVGDSGTGSLVIYGDLYNSGDCYIAAEPGSVGDAHLYWNVVYMGVWYNNDSLYIGGDDEGPGGIGTVTLDGGYLTVVDDTVVWSTGSFIMNQGIVFLNDVSIRNGGEFTVNDGELDCVDVEVFYNGTLSNTEGTTSGRILNSAGTINVTGGTLDMALEFHQNASCEVNLSGDGTINTGTLTGDDCTWNWEGGSLNITNGSLSIDDGKPLGDNLSISANESLSISNTLLVGPTSSGTLSVDSGGTITNHDAYLASQPATTAQITLHGPGTQWDCDGDFYAGGDETGPKGSGTLNVNALAELTVGETMRVWDNFSVGINTGVIRTTDLDITGEIIVPTSGVLDVSGGTIDIWNGGTLDGVIMGDESTSVALYDAGTSWTMLGSLLIGASDYGCNHLNSLILEPGTTVTVDEEVTVADISKFKLAGGTINTDLLNLQNANFSDFGTVNGKFLTTGSVTATGDLVLGDSNSNSGVQINGMLDVGPHHVTLNKQNAVFVYGSTSIGGGTLVTPGGFGLTSSLVLSGSGVMVTPDDPSASLLNDGLIIGDSTRERIEITGYMKGFGMLDHVTITGTDSPGYDDPAAVARGDVIYDGKLIIEIGGLTAGSEHDQINFTYVAGLGGELVVQLINGFEPALGDSFTIVTYAALAHRFDRLSLPALAAGLYWHVDYEASGVVLRITDQVPGDCDMDGDVDLADYTVFESCLVGPGGYPGVGCECSDLDFDGDTDLRDCAGFQAYFTGS